MKLYDSFQATLQQAKRWLGATEPVMMLALLLIAAGIWVFIVVADKVMEGGTQDFDDWAIRALRHPDNLADPLGPQWAQELARDATALGGVGWLVFFTFAVSGYLWLTGKRHLMIFLLAAASSGAVLAFGLKHVFSRPRPELVPHLSFVASSSFPSAHSMISAIVYITLGAIVDTVVTHWRVRAYLLFLAILIPVIVGISRVYLGVHYPTDVLAGWMAGLSWATACWLVARWLQRRDRVESG